MKLLGIYLTGERHGGDPPPQEVDFGFDLLVSKNLFNPLLSDKDECLLYLRTLKLAVDRIPEGNLLPPGYTHFLIIRDSSLLTCSHKRLTKRLHLLMVQSADLVFLSRWKDRCDKQKIVYTDKIGKLKTTLEPNSSQAILYSQRGLLEVYHHLKTALRRDDEHLKLNKFLNQLIKNKHVSAICHDPPLFVYDSDLAAHHNSYLKNSTCMIYENQVEQEETNFLLMFLLILIVLVILTVIIVRY